MKTFYAYLAVALLMGAAASRAADDVMSGVIFDIPQLEGVRIDGNRWDWAGRGFEVRVMDLESDSSYFRSGRLPDKSDFDPSFSLGWCENGLLVLVEVSDDVGAEHEALGNLWQMDCIELFVADRRGGDAALQVVIGPGTDPEQAGPRFHFFNPRDLDIPVGGFSVEVATRQNAGV